MEAEHQAFTQQLPVLSFDRTQFILWEFLRYAAIGGIEEGKGEGFVQEAALLFDQLITLVAAAQAPHQDCRANQPNLISGQEGTDHE